MVAKSDKVITDEKIKEYNKLVDFWIRKGVIKNWGLTKLSQSSEDMSLGASGWTIADVRQHLMCEVFIALRNFNVEGKDGKVTKESTFVYNHLFNRVGQLMKRLTKKGKGYGAWVSNLETVLYELDEE